MLEQIQPMEHALCLQYAPHPKGGCHLWSPPIHLAPSIFGRTDQLPLSILQCHSGSNHPSFSRAPLICHIAEAIGPTCLLCVIEESSARASSLLIAFFVRPLSRGIVSICFSFSLCMGIPPDWGFPHFPKWSCSELPEQYEEMFNASSIWEVGSLLLFAYPRPFMKSCVRILIPIRFSLS